MLTSEANRTVERRGCALIGSQTGGMRNFNEKWERINEKEWQTEFLSRRGGSKETGHRMG
jgi:hypothetical protein